MLFEVEISRKIRGKIFVRANCADTAEFLAMFSKESNVDWENPSEEWEVVSVKKVGEEL